MYISYPFETGQLQSKGTSADLAASKSYFNFAEPSKFFAASHRGGGSARAGVTRFRGGGGVLSQRADLRVALLTPAVVLLQSVQVRFRPELDLGNDQLQSGYKSCWATLYVPSSFPSFLPPSLPFCRAPPPPQHMHSVPFLAKQ